VNPAGLPREWARLLFFLQMPSGKKTRKAERDGAKRARSQPGAAGATAATNPLGDWTSQTADPSVLFRALGAEHVKQRAAAGDPAAQFSMGHWILGEENEGTHHTALGAAGRSQKAEARSLGWHAHRNVSGRSQH
jgi:hypothetical protein